MPLTAGPSPPRGGGSFRIGSDYNSPPPGLPSTMFDPVASSVHFPTLEAEIGRFWREERIYQRSLERPAPNGPFIFYEGPPTANGMPHPGHCLTRAIKDLFPRYR